MVALIDLTRLVSRLGRGALTGIDRVELAYAQRFVAAGPVHGLVRTALGYVLLDQGGVALVVALATGAQPLGPHDMIGRVLRRGDPLRARAEATVRRRAVARASGPGLARMLRALGRVDYYNVGHANLRGSVMRAVKATGGQITVLVHDVIPLDHPGFTRAGIPAVFARKLAVVSRHADRVIHLTQTARAQTEARMTRVPPGIVAALGVPVPVPGDLPAGMGLRQPYFVTVGTIEPRKNHALLLQVWAELVARRGAGAPQLVIAGGRGWADDTVLAALDAHPAGVIEVAGLSDGALAHVVAESAALLFPTFAEGFGLPPVEAAALGVPVICSDLSVLHDVLGDYPVYLDPRAVYSWLETIENLLDGKTTGKDQAAQRKMLSVPTWDAHFNAVLKSD